MTENKQKLTKRERDINKKEAILKAALELFSCNGFGGARIETVAKSVGLSYGAVYYHYPSKEVLFHMVVEYAMEQAIKLYYDATNIPATSAYEELVNYTNLFFKWIDTTEGAQSLMLLSTVMTANNIPDITRIFSKDRFQNIFNHVHGIMSRLKEEGYVKDKSADELTTLFNSMMIGSAFLRISKLGTPLDVNNFLSFVK